MENLEFSVGTPECSIQTVVSVIMEDENVIDNWVSLARGLDIPYAAIRKLQQDLVLNKISYFDLLYDVLEQWVGLKGRGATLGILILLMEEECKAVNVGESFRRHFNWRTSIYNSISWEHLPKALQERAIKNLHKLIPNMAIEDIKPNLNGIVLRQLVKKMPQTLPEKLSYYVARTVHSRNIISQDIFDKRPTHIFLISGIQRYELSRFAKEKTTDNSSNQILQRKVTVNYMKLDSPHHFEKICTLTSEPVHWFSFEDNKLKWIKSREGLSAVQKFVDKSQESLHEEDFVRSFRLNSNQPICISDSPGMGKTVFLAEIGRKLVCLYPDRTVIFLVLGEFIETVKKIDIKGLLHQTTESSIKNTVSIELLLDGFDEVDVSEREFVHELLRTIRTCCKSIRMWVSSRPHLLEELESTLDTIGFNIQPFSVEEQVRFLTSYWLAINPNITNQDKLTTFANHSLATLKSKDSDIAGVPLQCFLIGEVYEEEASAFSMSEESTSTAILITSITELCESVIHRKFQKCAWTGSERMMMDMHARLSLELMFPEQFEKLKDQFGPVETEKILKIGIVQASNNSTVPRFLHRTFAEYFVAWFVGDRLKDCIADEPFMDFFITNVLECNTGYEHPRIDNFEGSKFSQDVITYFFNSSKDNIFCIPTYIATDTINIFNSEDIIRKIAWACVASDRIQIFKLLRRLAGFELLKDENFAVKMLDQSFHDSSLEFVKTLLEQFEEQHTFSYSVQFSSLCAAVKRGKFSIVEFLLKERQLQRMLKELNSDTSNLAHYSVMGSSRDSSLEIDEKIQIIRMLSDINPALVNMKDCGGNTPLVSFLVHIRLRIELIRLGANVLNVNETSKTVLHLIYFEGDMLSRSTDFHCLMLCIPDKDLKVLVKVKDIYLKRTPLHNIFEYIDPVSATLDEFKKVGADFNCVDKYGHSPLVLALIYGRNGSTIRKLIECGADVHWKKGWKRKTLLHLAAVESHVLPESVAVLLEWIDPNVRDLRRKTPMDYARKRGADYVERFKQGLALAGKSN